MCKKTIAISAILLIEISLFPIISTAELRDPTKPGYPIDAESNATVMDDDDLRLSAIWISGTSRRATINGVTVRQGERLFNSIDIIEIRREAVLINQQGIQKQLFLFRPLYKKNKPALPLS